MEIRNPMIALGVFVCLMSYAIAYLIKMKYNLWLDECKKKEYKEPKAIEYTTGLKFSTFVFKWVKYMIGFLLALYNNFFVALLGIAVLILSRLYDDRQTR